MHYVLWVDIELHQTDCDLVYKNDMMIHEEQHLVSQSGADSLKKFKIRLTLAELDHKHLFFQSKLWHQKMFFNQS